ncbi:hypothetical protein F5Y00DRAFT_274247 [Daldinia vernicosa]|uniref:uncharacterized protein n=1 Tax=Daldinia vernicosa TaxID=114800 RepID=UPI002008AF52|nr:uncharacterized protein F5Y00DRAFT_274247 [Daldinia vernicosa]KAI0851993.1 hypothetical protein F5Y00DRAFT_274247 [Daldinia vernicosa]
MSEHAYENNEQPTPPLLEHDCSEWKTSSQHMEDLYFSGARLWQKDDLIDIEQQLSQFRTIEKFTIWCVDGSVIYIKNPMCGVQRPIWFPTVKFQEYWRLVKATPDGPPETYRCSYLVDWENRSARDSRGLIENTAVSLLDRYQLWDRSKTCKSFESLINKVLYGRKVSKIICFGLGDICLRTPEWWREQTGTNWQQIEADIMEGRIKQYLAVLAIFIGICSSTGDSVPILTQDPDYAEETKETLRELGFKVVGQFGAGGFAEVDDESIVFTAFAAAPVKQIIADIARPVVIIAVGEGKTFNAKDQPYGDPESPRTKQMWQDYESWDFPVDPSEAQSMGGMDKLKIYVRKTTNIIGSDVLLG